MLAITVLLTSCHKKSNENKILEFKFANPEVVGVITESAKTIVATMPAGTNVTALVPVITVSDKATVSPASGVVTDFTNPVTYTVTAESDVQAKYTVTVTVEGGGGGGGGGTSDPETWSGLIDANTTWKDLGLPVDYIIEGRLNIDGNALLTIEPGVTIMFTASNGGITVGENAGLKMVGTAEKPIVLVGPANNPNNGSWENIEVFSKRSDNQFEYVQFLRGGSDDSNYGNVVSVKGKISMKNCLVDGSLGNGVLTGSDGYFNAFENNTIKNCAKNPWLTENYFALCKNIGDGNVFEDNGINMISHNGEKYFDLEENLTIKEMPIPYCFDKCYLLGDKTLTIEEGVEIVFHSEGEMEIDEKCKFVANGTAEKPIIFRAENDEVWRGIIFKSTSTGNIINNCHIGNCGVNDGWSERNCLYISGGYNITITNNVFGPSNYNGVGIANISEWGNVTHSGNVLQNCQEGNVWIEEGGDYNGVTYENGQVLDELP